MMADRQTLSGGRWLSAFSYQSSRLAAAPTRNRMMVLLTAKGISQKKILPRSIRIIGLAKKSLQIFGFKGVIGKIFRNKDLALVPAILC